MSDDLDRLKQMLVKLFSEPDAESVSMAWVEGWLTNGDPRTSIAQAFQCVEKALKPNVTFEYGIASASDKVTILIKEERSEVDISQFFPEGRDDLGRGAQQMGMVGAVLL